MKSQLLSITLLFVIGQAIGGSIGGQFEKEQNSRHPKPNWGVSTIAQLGNIDQVIGGSIGGQFEKEQNPRPLAQVSTLAQLENEEVPEDTDNNDCSGGSKSEIRNCCTEDSPCDVGQGHCKANRGCKGELVCGRKNCDISKFPRKRTRCCEVANSTTNSTTPVENMVENAKKKVMNVFKKVDAAVKKAKKDDASEDAVDATTPPDVRATAPLAPSTPASLYRLQAQNEKKKGGEKLPLAK